VTATFLVRGAFRGLRLGALTLAASFATFATSGTASAMTCEDVMQLVDLEVPASSIIDAMKADSSLPDVACLQKRGAPAEVIRAAQQMAGGSATSTPTRSASAPSRPTADDEDDLPESGSEFDQTDALPTRRGGEAADDDANADFGGCRGLETAIDQQKAGQNQTAAEGLFKILDQDACPDKKIQVEYYLAKALFELEFFYGAQNYFLEVVREGPTSPYFSKALPKVVAIAERTGNDYDLLRVVTKIQPQDYPRSARPLLYYLMGRKSYDSADLTAAASNFDQVPEQHYLYPRAQYFLGLINHEQGRQKSAAKAFREVAKAQPKNITETDARELKELGDLAIINLGRMYFALKNMEVARAQYQKVDRNSVYWPTSLFERSWVEFWENDLNQVLGLLLSVDSPYFSESEFLPESAYLRAVTHFQYCGYQDVERLSQKFKATYQPVRAELKAFIDQYRPREGESDPAFDRAFDTYFGPRAGASKLPVALLARILRNHDLSSYVRTLDAMDGEESLIDQQRASFVNGLGQRLHKVYEEGRTRYKRSAGRTMLQEMAEQYKQIDGLLQDFDVLEFEVADAQREDYMFKMNNPEVSAADKAQIDFATAYDIIYWPFNGEFWRDELGYHRYTEQGSCQGQ
jgi:TolA-binding protein